MCCIHQNVHVLVRVVIITIGGSGVARVHVDWSENRKIFISTFFTCNFYHVSCETDESSAALRRESLRQFPRFNPNLSFVAFNYNPLYLEFLGENRKKLQPGCGRTIYSELQTVNSRLKQ